MERDRNERQKRSAAEHRVSSNAGCSSTSSTDSPPEKKCCRDIIFEERPILTGKSLSTQVNQEFCEAAGRPDSEVEHTYGIPNRILVRKTATAGHVMLMGTTSFMLDPLRCPYGEEDDPSDVCKRFRAAGTEFMKNHLEVHHQMSNVLINLVCPCLPKWYKDKSCSVVKFDSSNDILLDHLLRVHETYYKHVQEKLYAQMMDEVHLMRRTKFPSWTNTERLFPSQIIPDKIVFPTVIQNKVLHFVCHIDTCQERLFNHPTRLHYHVYSEHGHRFGSQTRMYHACPVQYCPVEAYAVSELIISHVAAMHPEAVGRRFSPEVKEKCSKYLGLVVGNCVGLAVTNSVQTDDGTAGTEPRSLEVYRCPVENCSEFFLEERDHLVWHILDCHALQWSVSTSAVHQ